MKRVYIAAACALLAIAVGLLVSQQVFVPVAGSPGMRIVSLAPSVTEMLFALGMQDAIVGVTTFCDYPPEARRIERVGGLGSPNIEKLLALSPDLVIGTDLRRTGVINVLQTSNTPVLEVNIRSFQEMCEAIEKIGRAVGEPDKARQVVATMQRELDAVSELNEDTPPENRPRVFLEIWGDPLTTAGEKSFLDEVVRRAGGINVAHELPLEHPRVNAEKVIQWNPDVIVTCYMGRSGPTAADFVGRIGWSDIAAVKHGRIINDIPADLLLRPGPRLVQGVRLLAERLHGDPSTQVAAPTAQRMGR